jgi:hypothetical protein
LEEIFENLGKYLYLFKDIVHLEKQMKGATSSANDKKIKIEYDAKISKVKSPLKDKYGGQGARLFDELIRLYLQILEVEASKVQSKSQSDLEAM